MDGTIWRRDRASSVDTPSWLVRLARLAHLEDADDITGRHDSEHVDDPNKGATVYLLNRIVQIRIGRGGFPRRARFAEVWESWFGCQKL